MNSQALENTLPLSDEIVGAAWRDFIGTSPPLISVPAFLSWLGNNQPQVLKIVNDTKLVNVAGALCKLEGSRSQPLEQ